MWEKRKEVRPTTKLSQTGGVVTVPFTNRGKKNGLLKKKKIDVSSEW